MGVPVIVGLHPVSNDEKPTEKQLFGGPRQNKEPTKTEAAEEWLRQILMGGRMTKQEVQRFASAEDITSATLDRAAKNIYVHSETEHDHNTKRNVTWWSLPAAPEGWEDDDE